MATRTWVCLHCRTCEVFVTGEPVKICPNCTNSEIVVYDGCHCMMCPVWTKCFLRGKEMTAEELKEACRQILEESKCREENEKE